MSIYIICTPQWLSNGITEGRETKITEVQQ